MRALLLAIMFCGVATSQARAQLAEAPITPRLDVSVSPETALATHGYVHGQLVVRIQLLSRFPFEELSLTPPRFEAADVVRLVRPRTREITGYAGRGFLYETAFAVTPLKPGPFNIPPVTAVGVVEPEKDRELRFDLASEPVDLTISDTPRAYDADWWLAAPRVEVDETWSKPVEDIRVGEVVQRRVSLRVWGVAAERLPELSHPPAQGVRISLRSAETRTETSFEGLIAHADYVWDLEIERQQIVFVKPIGVAYWDTNDHDQKASSAPAHRLEPLEADSEALADALMREAKGKRRQSTMLVAAIALALIAPLIVLATLFVAAAVPTQADRRLRRDCGAGATPEAIYNAIDDWLAASGLDRGDTRRRLPARAELSDQLFARDHPVAKNRRRLVGQALDWSRRRRIRALICRAGLSRRSEVDAIS